MAQASRPSARSREVTYEQYMRMPVTKKKCEVIDGVIMTMPSPRFKHQAYQDNIQRGLGDFVIRHDLGVVIPAPADLIIRKLPKLRVRQPDLLFFSNATAGFRCRDDLDRLQDSEVPPDLIVEVRSPSERPGQWAEKLADYASIRVREVWRVDPPAGTVEVLVLNGDLYERSGLFARGEVIRSIVLPGLDLPVAAIFD